MTLFQGRRGKGKVRMTSVFSNSFILNYSLCQGPNVGVVPHVPNVPYLIFNIVKYRKITIHTMLCYITHVEHTTFHTVDAHSTHGHTQREKGSVCFELK